MATIIQTQAGHTPNQFRINSNSNDTELNAELSTTIHADGSVPMSAPLNMGSSRIINTSAGIGSTDVVVKSQLEDEVNKFLGYNTLEVSPIYPAEDATSGRFSTVFKALDSITDATTNNWYFIKVKHHPDPATGYAEDLQTYCKNFVNMVGEDYPVITVAQGGGNTANIVQNGTISKIKFRFTGHDSLYSYLKLTGGIYEDCIFVLGDGATKVADLIPSNASMVNCKLVLDSSSEILLDGTTYNYLTLCQSSVGITVGSAVNDGDLNITVPNLGDYFR